MTLPNREYAYAKKRTHRPALVALVAAVSYTHLDVYKRQEWYSGAECC